jgi:IS30 family transposase
LIIGLDRSAVGTLVERTSRFTMLVHLPREAGYGLIPRTKNAPRLAGYGAVTMANALKKAVTKLPTHLWQSLTWDRGKELSDHARFTVEPGCRFSLLIPTARGNAARTRTRMGCCANTSPRAPIYHGGAIKRFKQ